MPASSHILTRNCTRVSNSTRQRLISSRTVLYTSPPWSSLAPHGHSSMQLSLVRRHLLRPMMSGGAAKERVADYPRPPRLERTSKHLRVLLGGEVVADTRSGYRVLETHSPPTFYFPPSDVNTQLLRKSDHSTVCEWKGTATYWDVRTAAGAEAKRRAWSYEDPTPSFQPIQRCIAFYPSPFKCYVDDEEVTPQPGTFYAGWITSDVEGPFKGGPGTSGW